jgi:hypothetical protein
MGGEEDAGKRMFRCWAGRERVTKREAMTVAELPWVREGGGWSK